MSLPTVVDSWLWPAFVGAVAFLLFLDLFVFHKNDKAMPIKEAISWSIFWVVLAGLFSTWFTLRYGANIGLQFVTGYLVEMSLSIDNLFVILLVFKSFHVAEKYQHRVLFWGIFGAILMRAILILFGVDLIHRFHWIMYIFGLILLVSGIKFLFETDSEKDITKHWAVRFTKKLIPVKMEFHGQKFWIKENNRWYATPLFLALIVVEATDLVFAVDSIPAVLAVTTDAFVAFGSNILAILGLRALYFVIADWVGRFRYLKPGLAAILCFIGVKMLIVDIYKIPSWVSLIVIIMILITAALTSWYANRASILVDNDKR